MRTRLSIICYIGLIGCSRTPNPQDIAHAREAEQVKEQFSDYYVQWRIECQQPKVRIMSDARVFTSLPGYRAIVSLGRPALPLLQEKLEHDSGFDYMLVYAVMEIEGWKETEFPHKEMSVQEDRDHVLARMRAKK